MRALACRVHVGAVLGPSNSLWLLRGTLSCILSGKLSKSNFAPEAAVAGPGEYCASSSVPPHVADPRGTCILSSYLVSWSKQVHPCLCAFAGAATTASLSARPATSARRPSPAAVAAAAGVVVAAAAAMTAGGVMVATQAVGATTMVAVVVAASALARLCAVTTGADATTGAEGITTAVGGTDVPVARAQGTLGPLAMPWHSPTRRPPALSWRRGSGRTRRGRRDAACGWRARLLSRTLQLCWCLCAAVGFAG